MLQATPGCALTLLLARKPGTPEYRVSGHGGIRCDLVELLETSNLASKLSLLSERWSLKLVAELNLQQVKVVKLKGEFLWHPHEQEDEPFLVLPGWL